MEVSSRITKSLFYFLEKKQISLSLEIAEFSPNSPLGWFDPVAASIYISQAETEYAKVYGGSLFYKDWAEASFSLRAWEGLDSVLRVMPSPEPDRLTYFLAQFFSYFISPSLNLTSLSSEEEQVKIETSISETAFPEVAKYLTACISYIPCFTKNSSVDCSWLGNTLQLKFLNQQSTIFDAAASRTHITPELMSSLLEDFKKKEELLIVREKFLLKKEKVLEKRENDFLLSKKKREKQLKTGLLSSFSQLFKMSLKSSLKAKKVKIKTRKNNISDQFSFDID